MTDKVYIPITILLNQQVLILSEIVDSLCLLVVVSCVYLRSARYDPQRRLRQVASWRDDEPELRRILPLTTTHTACLGTVPTVYTWRSQQPVQFFLYRSLFITHTEHPSQQSRAAAAPQERPDRG